MNKNVIAVIDGEAGSCGKAKVVGEIASTYNVGASITNCMPNAGHTFVSDDNRKYVFRNIPVSIVNPKTELFIGPGSAIDMDIFVSEYESVKHLLGDRKIYVHEMVPLIEERHKEYERNNLKSGSTFKGCGAVSKDKIMRDKKLQFFKSFKNAVVCSNSEWLDRVYSYLDNPFEYVLLEGAQGCDLSLNHSGQYPYVTSRNVSTAQLLADSGISPEHLLQTIMAIRPYPIRISNITKSGEYIYSGGFGKGNSIPLTWSNINYASLYGGYAYPGNIDCFLDINLAHQYVQIMYDNCSELYLLQLFGPNYKNINLYNLKPIQYIELERLMFKSNGVNSYNSRILKLPCLFNSDTGDNYLIDLSEQTTVTKMERRIFDIDIDQLKQNCRINSPYGIYLNFVQHLDYDLFRKSGKYEDFYFDRYFREYISWLESNTNTDVLALGTGAKNGERILKKSLIKE